MKLYCIISIEQEKEKEKKRTLWLHCDHLTLCALNSVRRALVHLGRLKTLVQTGTAGPQTSSQHQEQTTWDSLHWPEAVIREWYYLVTGQTQDKRVKTSMQAAQWRQRPASEEENIMAIHQTFPTSRRNSVSWGVAGAILRKREMYKTVFEYLPGLFWVVVVFYDRFVNFI